MGYFSKNELINILQCKRKYIFSYYEHNIKPAKFPTHLLQIAREERRFKKEFFEEQSTLCKAIRIKESRNVEKMSAESLKAIQEQYDLIFNAVLINGQQIAKYDLILKIALVDENQKKHSGFATCILTTSNEVTRNHIIELYWNTIVLNGLLSQHNTIGLFINQDGKQIEINLSDVHIQVQDIIEQTRSLNLKNFEEENPPFYCQTCKTCEWRYVCVPRIVDEKSLSLLPEITLGKSKTLRRNGIVSVEDLADTPIDKLESLNFDEIDIKNLQYNCKRIIDKKLIFKKRIKKEYFLNSVPVSISFSNINGYLNPKMILFLNGDKVEYIKHFKPENIDSASYENDMNKFSKLMSQKVIAFGTDHMWLKKIAENHRHYKVDLINMVDFIDSYIHTPVLGLELSELKSLGNPDKMNEFVNKKNKKLFYNAYERIFLLSDIIKYLIEEME